MTAVRGSGQAQALARDLLIVSRQATPDGYVSLGVAAGFLIVWHIPFFFNLAVLDDTFHILEHLSFIIAGGGVGFGLPLMSKWTRLGGRPHRGVLGSLPLRHPGSLRAARLRGMSPGTRGHLGVAMIYAMMPLMLYAVRRFLVEQVSEGVVGSLGSHRDQNPLKPGGTDCVCETGRSPRTVHRDFLPPPT